MGAPISTQDWSYLNPANWAGASYAPAQANTIGAIEAAIVAQLQNYAAANPGSALAMVEIAHFPDKPESYRLVNRVGAVLVEFSGAEYQPEDDTALVVQERRLSFEVNVLARDLGWGYGALASGTSPGAYALLDAVRTALTGFRPPGCKKMRPVRERFLERDAQGAIWYYSAEFVCSTVAMEAQPAAPAAALVSARALEKSGQTTRSVAAAPYIFNASNQVQLVKGNVSNVVVTSDPAGTTYVQGVDYNLDAVNGVLTLISGGAIAAGATVLVAYSYADVVSTATAQNGAPTN